MSNKEEKLEKEINANTKRISKILIAVLGGLTKKFSIELILGAKRQLDEAILRIKKGILAGFFLIFGIFFLLLGLAFYLESILGFVAGGGFLTVGISGILLAILITLFKK